MSWLDVVSAFTQFDLAQASDRPIVIDDADVPAMMRDLDRHRLVGVAAAAVERGRVEGAIACSAIAARHDEVMASSARIELLARRCSTRLAEAGIDHRLLKGAALAHLVASDSSEREYRDVDLLVPSESMDAAVDAMGDLGARRRRPELRPGFDRRFAKSVTMRLDGLEIDLHRTIAPGPFGALVKPGDLFVLPAAVRLAGRQVPTLDRTDHLVHACYHVALGSPTPVATNLRDVVLLGSGAIDTERAVATIRRWQGEAAVQRAIRLVDESIGWLPAPLGVLRDELDAGRTDMVECYLHGDDRFAEMAKATLRVLTGRDRIDYALAIGLPDGTSAVDRVRGLLSRE